MTLRCVLCTPIALAVALCCGSARASESNAVLTYDVDRGHCPSSDQFADWVTSRLGRSLFAPEAQSTVRIHLRETPTGLVVSLRILGPGLLVDREFQGSTEQCADLIEAAASATAIAFDTLTPRDHTPPPVVAAPEPSREESTPTPRPHPEFQPTIERPRPSRWHAGLGALGSWIVPSLLGGGYLSADYRFATRWSVGARAEWGTTLSDATLEAGDRARFELWTATLPICAHTGPLAGCLSTRAGVLRSHVDHVTRPNQSTALITVGPELVAAFPLSNNVQLVALLQLHCAASRVRLELDNATAWSMPLLVGAGGVGVRGSLSWSDER